MTGSVAEFVDDYDTNDEIPQSVVRAANPGVIDPTARMSLRDMIEPVAAQKADVLERKIAADEAVFGHTNAQIAQDRARMVKAFDAMGVEAEKLQPWDADAQREKFRTDPIASFGSIGSVFAMIASAFTHQPMTNALNASAAAMMAIKDGNEAEYEKAFRAFKENNDLVVKRHGMMNQAYHNAATLMDKDIAAGKIALLENATRFGDQNLAVMLNNGMDKEALDYVASFGKMTRDQMELQQYLTQTAYQNKVFEAVKNRNEQEIADPATRAAHDLAAFNRIFKAKQDSPAQAILGQALLENPHWGVKEVAEFAQKYHLLPHQLSSAGERLLEPYKADIRIAHPEWSEGQVQAEAEKQHAAASQKPGVVTNTRLDAQLRQNIKTQLMKPKSEGGEGLSELDADKRATLEVRSLNPAARDRAEAVQSVTNQIDFAKRILDTAPLSVTGLSGKAVRIGEWTNLFENEQEGHAFEQSIRLIQQMLPKALPGGSRNMRNAKDREDYDAIVPGLGIFTGAEASKKGLERLRSIINGVDLLKEPTLPANDPLQRIREILQSRGIDPDKIK